MLKAFNDLKIQLSTRDEELLRMSRMYSNEKEKVKHLEKEIKEKDMIISQLSVQQNTLSEQNDTMFGKDSSQSAMKVPSTIMKNL